MKQPPQPMAGASESPWTMTSSTMLKLATQVYAGLCYNICQTYPMPVLVCQECMLFGLDLANETCVKLLFIR